jgi:hypothetical protein
MRLNQIRDLIAVSEAAHRYIQRIPVRESIPRPRIGLFTRADTPLSPTAALMMQALVGVARSRAKR